MAFGSPVEAGEVVADGAVLGLDQVGVGFALAVRLGHPGSGKGERVAGVGVGADEADLGRAPLHLAVKALGRLDAFADVEGDDAAPAARVGAPHDGALFCTKV